MVGRIKRIEIEFTKMTRSRRRMSNSRLRDPKTRSFKSFAYRHSEARIVVMIIGAKRWEQKATVFRRTATRAVAVLLLEGLSPAL